MSLSGLCGEEMLGNGLRSPSTLVSVGVGVPALYAVYLN